MKRRGEGSQEEMRGGRKWDRQEVKGIRMDGVELFLDGKVEECRI
jgi:hypothetical protein